MDNSVFAHICAHRLVSFTHIVPKSDVEAESCIWCTDTRSLFENLLTFIWSQLRLLQKISHDNW